jgi:hypothetical protein
MILGMAHLAHSVTDIDRGRKQLESRGFECVFLEKNVINNSAKKYLLKNYESTHDICLLRNSRLNLAIEIINHGHLCESRMGSYQLKDDSIELLTPNLGREKTFWLEVLGFKEKGENLLTFSSIIPSWSCTIKLVEKPQIKLATLESIGYPCMAFFTNNLDQDIKTAQLGGAYELTDFFDFSINNRNLKIVMFRTPGGAICELIQPKR